jgi:uncharacterized membrane protein YqjE
MRYGLGALCIANLQTWRAFNIAMLTHSTGIMVVSLLQIIAIWGTYECWLLIMAQEYLIVIAVISGRSVYRINKAITFIVRRTSR